MAIRLGRLTASTALEHDLVTVISTVTGLSMRKVKNRLEYARGNTLVRNVLASYWPHDCTSLGEFTVAFARNVGLHEEIVHASALSERTVTKRLNVESGNKLLANAFPEMTKDDDVEAADQHEDSDGDEATAAAEGEEEDDDEAEATGSYVHLREQRVVNVRADADAIQQLATLLGLSDGNVRRHLRDAHGKTLVGNLFARWWPSLESSGTEMGSAVGAGTEAERQTAAQDLVARRWRIVCKLGKGGFGTAYEVRDEKHPNLGIAVLKFADGAGSVDRLREEVGVAYDLNHQNICVYRDLDEDARRGMFIVLQHGGRSLEKLIEERGAFEIPDALEIIRQAAAGIDYAHNQGVLHQDIKPGNILVRERERGQVEVRISDFGISLRGRATEATGGGRTIVATMALGFSRYFASPEQVSGRQVSRKSDQYSLALVFCAMLEGEVFDSPYSRRTFPRLSSRQNAALERALRREPSERFPSCCHLADALASA